jgi:hypothetical protein
MLDGLRTDRLKAYTLNVPPGHSNVGPQVGFDPQTHWVLGPDKKTVRANFESVAVAMCALCIERYIVFGPRFQYPRCFFVVKDKTGSIFKGDDVSSFKKNGRDGLYALDRIICVEVDQDGVEDFFLIDIHNGNVLYGEDTVVASIPHYTDGTWAKRKAEAFLKEMGAPSVVFLDRKLEGGRVVNSKMLDTPEKLCRAIDIASRDYDTDDLLARVNEVEAEGRGAYYQKMLSMAFLSYVVPTEPEQGDWPVPTEIADVDTVYETIKAVAPSLQGGGGVNAAFDALYAAGHFDYLLREEEEEEGYRGGYGYEDPDTWMSSPESDVSDGTLERCTRMAGEISYAHSEDEISVY